MNNKSLNQRDSNFELMRIVAMFLIILHHLCLHGLFFAPDSNISINFLISKCLFGWTGHIGNWLFIFLSGYYAVNSNFKFKKLFSIWFQIFSISSIIGLIVYLSKIPIIGFSSEQSLIYTAQGFDVAANSASKKDLLYAFLPTYFGNNWFANTYLIFYLCIPFLNAIIVNGGFEKAIHLRLCILLFILGMLIPLLPFEGCYNPSLLIYFILGYFTAQYIRLYDPAILKNLKWNIIISFIFIVFFIAWIIICYTVMTRISFLCKESSMGGRYYDLLARLVTNGINRPLVFFAALFIFCVFRNIKIQNNSILNVFASTTFGVYLIHENPLIRKWIWHKLFNLDKWVNNPLLLLYMLFCVVATFLICALLELFRRNLFRIPFLRSKVR